MDHYWIIQLGLDRYVAIHSDCYTPKLPTDYNFDSSGAVYRGRSLLDYVLIRLSS